MCQGKLLILTEFDTLLVVKMSPAPLLPLFWQEVGYSGVPPNPISFPSGSRYVILRTPFE